MIIIDIIINNNVNAMLEKQMYFAYVMKTVQ